MRETVRALTLLWVVLILTGCGGGSDGTAWGGGTAPAPQGGGGRPDLFASAEVSLRSSKPLPGSNQVALQAPWWLRLVAEPVLAQTLFTVPGARVDAYGVTFTTADEQGIARFLQLPVGAYRFVITTPDASTVFQTLAEAGAGATLELEVTEETTAATLLCEAAQQQLGIGPGGADLEALLSLFESRANPDFNTLYGLVSGRLGEGAPWLDEEYRPDETVVRESIDAAQGEDS